MCLAFFLQSSPLWFQHRFWSLSLFPNHCLRHHTCHLLLFLTVVFIFNINLGVRGLSSSPALHSSNFYTVTYEIGETGEKHTVQVNIDQNGRTMIIWTDFSIGIAGKRRRQPAGHCHQQRHRPGWVWGMWRHPCLLHLSCRVHAGLYSASDQGFS